jgi:hypothetical protein
LPGILTALELQTPEGRHFWGKVLTGGVIKNFPKEEQYRGPVDARTSRPVGNPHAPIVIVKSPLHHANQTSRPVGNPHAPIVKSPLHHANLPSTPPQPNFKIPYNK